VLFFPPNLDPFLFCSKKIVGYSTWQTTQVEE
jgi:hypothetical protein